MPLEVIMPALGMAQDTGQIVAWHKAQGDPVEKGDVLFEVETDKATMEVEAQGSGFLTDVRAEAGEDVPVGDVIATIAESADAPPSEKSSEKASEPKPDNTPEAAPASEEALPEGKSVIMPALGMAQDTGQIVAWHKALGDEVAKDDILFEVETDKATMDVEAGHDGFVAALLAEAGEDAPVGDPIAIISPTKPDAPVQRSLKKAASAPAPEPDAKSDAKSAPKTSEQKQKPARKGTTGSQPKSPPAGAGTAGRILASPKARRLALEQGLDLDRLVAAGYPQPYHAADIEVLKSLPADDAAPSQAATRHLSATLEADGFAAFAKWAAEKADLKDANALLAGLAAASLDRGDAVVAVESFGATRLYQVPDGPLGDIDEADPESAVDLRLRDLRMSPVRTVSLGPEDAPVLTLLGAATGLSITLECASNQLGAADAVSVLSNFAGRMEQPLRHLL